MVNLLVKSLMVDRGLENALVTAIAHEVQDPSAVLKPGVESTVPLLALVQQLVTNSTIQCSAFIEKVHMYLCVPLCTLVYPCVCLYISSDRTIWSSGTTIQLMCSWLLILKH